MILSAVSICSEHFFIEDLTDYDPQYLLAYMRPSPEALKKQGKTYHLYYLDYLVSKQDGTWKPLDLTVAEIKDGKMRLQKQTDNSHVRSHLKGYKTSPIIKTAMMFLFLILHAIRYMLFVRVNCLRSL